MIYKLKNGKAITIRDARIEDTEDIISYIKNIILESNNLTFENDEFNPTIEAEKQFLNSINTSENQCFLVACVDKEIIGNLTITVTDRARLKHSAELSITVLKEFWNQGVALNLMIEFTQWIKTTNLSKINLKVKDDNKYAILLYEKFGFIKEGEIARGFFIDGKYYNSICMGKLI